MLTSLLTLHPSCIAVGLLWRIRRYDVAFVSVAARGVQPLTVCYTEDGAFQAAEDGRREHESNPELTAATRTKAAHIGHCGEADGRGSNIQVALCVTELQEHLKHPPLQRRQALCATPKIGRRKQRENCRKERGSRRTEQTPNESGHTQHTRLHTHTMLVMVIRVSISSSSLVETLQRLGATPMRFLPDLGPREPTDGDNSFSSQQCSTN
jgi:hypothetical protein